MERENSDKVAARAYPAYSDAQQLRLTAVTGQGLPHLRRVGLKKLVRIGTLNIGSMTGKSREIADLMARRRINILCVQETRWRGNKAKEIGEGYKLIYSGANGQGRNGVGIILDKEWKEHLVRVNRRDDRIMSVGLDIGGATTNIVSAYAPQVGCDDEDKENFWRALDQEIGEIPTDERCFLGTDLNGHIGCERLGVERVHGGWGLASQNLEGERILDFAVASDMAVINSFYKKTENQYVTYSSGGTETQIDFILCKRNHLVEVKNCKVIKGESVSSQHRPVIVDCDLKIKRKGKQLGERKIKWWKLKDIVLAEAFKSEVLGRISTKEKANDWWETNSKVIMRVGEEILGRTSGKGQPGNKESWWWNSEVQEIIKAKKEAKKQFDRERSVANREAYKRSKKEAKRAVAIAKARALDELYDELDAPEGVNKLHRIAKARDRASKDFTHIRQMKDSEGVVLRSEKNIKKRWSDYFSKLLNEERPRVDRGKGIANENVTIGIERGEVSEALKRMKNGKAVGPDGIPVEVWKALGAEGVDLLLDLFRKIYKEEKMPDVWRDSVLVPLYKEKGDIQDCKNYRGIKLVSHTLKIWERVIEQRLRKETSISEEQFGFMPGKGTTDALFALRQLLEKHGEKLKELHLAFIDLEKAYDTVPREEMWRCMRVKGVPEKYVRLVKDTYDRAHTRVRSSVGLTERFSVRVGVHQGSALSPYLFNIIMDVLTEGVREQAPWTMLFADDIVVVDESKDGLEDKLERWRQAVEEGGLRISRAKTEYMWFGGDGRPGSITLQGQLLTRTGEFKYLGSYVNEKGELDREVNHRIQAGWINWKRMTGVLCDRRIQRKMKGKVFKAVVRPAMIYGSETWPVKKAQEKKLEVVEMRMLRWSMGKTRKDRIRNEVIRKMGGVIEVSKKIQERRLQWFGHVMRREDKYVGRKVSSMQLEGKRRRGRPKRRWKDCVVEDLREKELIEEDVLDRIEWRRRVRNSDPLPLKGKS